MSLVHLLMAGTPCPIFACDTESISQPVSYMFLQVGRTLLQTGQVPREFSSLPDHHKNNPIKDRLIRNDYPYNTISANKALFLVKKVTRRTMTN